MRGGKRIFELIRRSAMPALALVIVGTFGYHRALKERQTELAQLREDKAQLRHHSALLDPRKADPDMADELVRKDLGLVRPDEVIVPLD
jgi:hypothetical protein